MSQDNNQAKPLKVFSLGEAKELNSKPNEKSEADFEIEESERRCQRFQAGHNFHWIPIFNRSQPRIEIQAKWLQDNQFEVVVEGKTEIWFHHEPERLKAALARTKKGGIKATLGRPWIFVDAGDGSYAFNCSNKPMIPCFDEDDEDN
jgi:hypothetical protein